jgi:hypothetical protein
MSVPVASSAAASPPASLSCNPATPTRAVIALILAFLVFHLFLASTLGLGVDECYGIGVSHDFSLSYFDHPPLHYWIAHFSIPLLGEGRALRLPFVLLFSGTSWLLYLLTRRLFGAAAGFWAVLSLNLAPFFTLAGGWIVPDGPLMFCLVGAAHSLARGLFPSAEDGSQAVSPYATWLPAGLWLGFAGLSKYHVVLFVLGLFLYLVSAPGRWRILLHPAPWLGAAIALVLVTPVFVWNIEHHWVSLAFQGGRAKSYGDFPKIGGFLANLGGQFLWLGPWVFVPMVIAAYNALRKGRSDERAWYCLCLAAPAILLFTLVPLWGDRGLPHWQMPGWLMLFPVVGEHIMREASERTRPRTWAISSAAVLVALAVLFVGHAVTGYGRILFPAAFAKGDPTLESYEWTPLHDELSRRGLLDRPGLFVISASPIDIGKIDQALHDAMPMRVFGESKQYAFRGPPEALLGHDALIIGRSDRLPDIENRLAPYFDKIEELPRFSFGRSGMKEVEVRILYGHDLKKPLPSPYDNVLP